MKTQTTFTAYWLGKCPVKGCKCRLHIDVPMIRETWPAARHDHSTGYSWQVTERREYPAPPNGAHFHPWHLGMMCIEHRRDINWHPVNGKYSAAHACDSRCMNATGPDCECGCGGANHGRGYHLELHFNEGKQLQLV